MKRIYIFILAALTTTAVTAQSNLDFETWSGTPLMADDWTPSSAEDSVSQTTSPLSIGGNHSMLVSNTNFQDMNGQDSLGGSFVSQAMLVSPDSVHVSCLPNMVGTDTCQVLIGLFNGGAYQGALAASLDASQNPPLGQYYNLTFDLTQGGIPAFDAISVSFYSSKSPSDAGSFMVVDDVTLYGLANIEENTSEIAKIRVYPNPASDVANFSLGNSNVDQIRIVDITGKVMETIGVNQSVETVSLSNYHNGVYFYQIIKDNDVVKTSKFIVTK